MKTQGEQSGVRDLVRFRSLIIAHAALEHANDQLVRAERRCAQQADSETAELLRDIVKRLDGVVGRVEEMEGDIARAQAISSEEWLSWMSWKWNFQASAGGKK